MRGIIAGLLAGFILTLSGAEAQYRATVPHAAPMPAMPAPALPAPSPSLALPPSAPAARLPDSAPVAVPPTQNVPTCRRPEDCPDRTTEEEARRHFAECVEKSRIRSDALDTPTLEECALGFMSWTRFSKFKQCLARRETAWDCYRQAYR